MLPSFRSLDGRKQSAMLWHQLSPELPSRTEASACAGFRSGSSKVQVTDKLHIVILKGGIQRNSLNINILAGSSHDRAGVKELFMFLCMFFVPRFLGRGEEENPPNKIERKSGDNPGNLVYVFVCLVFFFAPQLIVFQSTLSFLTKKASPTHSSG